METDIITVFSSFKRRKATASIFYASTTDNVVRLSLIAAIILESHKLRKGLTKTEVPGTALTRP